MERDSRMETPLVIKKFTSEQDYMQLKSFKDAKYVIWNETVKIWWIAFPVALSSLFQYLKVSSVSIYAGHLGDIELSSISLYHGVIGSIYFQLLFGMSTALTTLCGQAFGAGQIQSTGIYVQSFNIQSWHLMLLVGIGTAVSVRVSNTLGMSHPRAAKYSFLVALFESLLLGIIFMIVIFLSKEEFAIIFTNSEDMIRAAGDLAYLLGITMVLNSASQVISGVAIGSGWQVMVAYINLVCYYLVGLPIGIFLGFKQNLGVKGLWGGTICGNILQILVLMMIIWKTNWTKEVEQTANRMRIWSSNNLRKNMIVNNIM